MTTFAIGLFVGVMLGYLIAALCFSASAGDQQQASSVSQATRDRLASGLGRLDPPTHKAPVYRMPSKRGTER